MRLFRGKLLSPELSARLGMADAELRAELISEIVRGMHARIKRNSQIVQKRLKDGPDFNQASSFRNIQPDADATQSHQLRAQASGISHQSQGQSGGSGVQAVPLTTDAARMETAR